jgi:hypothetical protein
VVVSAVRSASRRYAIAASRQSLLLFAIVAPAAAGLNRKHSPGSASPPGLWTSTLGQNLGFAGKRPLSQCSIEDTVPYVGMHSCPNSNRGTTEEGVIEPRITVESEPQSIPAYLCAPDGAAALRDRRLDRGRGNRPIRRTPGIGKNT